MSRVGARVAVVGIGVVGPEAIGVERFREKLRSGSTAIEEVTRFDTSLLNAHRGAFVKDFSPRDYIPASKIRRMNNLSRMAVAAMRLCLDDAGLDEPLPGSRQCGVSMGTTFGPVQTSVEYLREYVEKGAALAPPQLFAESVANAPGSHIAIEFGLEGFNLTFTQRESSAISALMYAASQIVKGTVGAAITGGVEEMNDITFSVLDRIGALAHPSGDRDEAARPFDHRRNGMVVGEGGAILLLRASDNTDTPKGKVYGYLSGFGIAKDPTASISNWGISAASLVRAMAHAISDAGILPQDIDAVWASANSTVACDALERIALQDFFNENIPPVVATKGYFGEYAAAGGLQIASALLAMQQQELFPSVGFERGDPGTDLPIVVERRPAHLRHILVNSLSAGGGMVSAVISRSADD
ncbi:MAG: beta-ketoacyl synthase N-terminal-like domain-containing protein [Acidobacteriota bacterium]